MRPKGFSSPSHSSIILSLAVSSLNVNELSTLPNVCSSTTSIYNLSPQNFGGSTFRLGLVEVRTLRFDYSDPSYIGISDADLLFNSSTTGSLARFLGVWATSGGVS